MGGGRRLRGGIFSRLRGRHAPEGRQTSSLRDFFLAWLAGRRESSFEDGGCKVPSVGVVKSAEFGMMPVGSGMVPAVFRGRWGHAYYDLSVQRATGLIRRAAQ